MKLKVNIVVLSVLLLGILGTSCVSQKKLTYLNGVQPEMADSINQTFHAQREAHIVCGDQLSIVVNAMDMEAAQMFNLPIANQQRVGSERASSISTLQYYTVDSQGNINFPVLGEFRVEGLTLSEVRDTLQSAISRSLKNPIVNIHLLNYHVTVLGEVKNPGAYSFDMERVTIFDALGRAGDMTSYGKREDVLVTRETNGKMEFARLNLNEPTIYASPFYYLQQNDVVYVSPNKVRAVTSQHISLYLSTLSTLGSMATVVISVWKFTDSKSND